MDRCIRTLCRTPSQGIKGKGKALGRGLLDAYLATQDTGHLFELKQKWMTPAETDKVFRYDTSDPFPIAKQQIQQLDHSESFSKGQDFMSWYGAFLVPHYDKKTWRITRKQAFDRLVDFCKEKEFEAYAVFAPNLKNKALTRSDQNTYRPVVAIGLQVYSPQK